jgi:hypothetical protein
LEHKEKTNRRDVQKEFDLKYAFTIDVHDTRFACAYTGRDFEIDLNRAAFQKGLTGTVGCCRIRGGGSEDESKIERNRK